MNLESQDLTDWTFEVDEVSAGVYKVIGRDASGRSVEKKGQDLEKLLEECKEIARSKTV